MKNGSKFKTESVFPIQIDPLAALALNTQITEQIKLLIATEALQAGDSLPPVTQLAKQLNVNHNTIAAVYTTLTELGYLTAQRGKGTFVNDSSATHQLLEHKQYLSLLAQAFAAAPQLSPADFSGVAYAQAALLNQSRSPLNLVFVEEALPEQMELCKQIEAEIGSSLTFLDCQLLEASQSFSLKQLAAADLIVTTRAQAWQVTQQSQQMQEVVVVDARPAPDLLTHLASLPRGTQMLLVGYELTESEYMKQLFLEAGITHLDFHKIDVEKFQYQQDKLAQTENICLSKRVNAQLDFVKKSTSTVLVFNSSIDSARLLVLKARIRLLSSDALSF